MKKICICHETGEGRLGGHFTQFAFKGLPGVEIAALCDSNDDGIEERMRLTEASRRYRNYKEMMEKERPEIVILCSRLPEDHYEQIKLAISMNCHVLCEKPFVADLRQADELIELAEAKKIKILIAHLGRYALVFRTMKKMIEDGAIGRVLTFYGRGKEDPRGGGEDMIVLGTHILDLGAYLFGAPEQVWADIRVNGKPITAKDRLKTEEPVGPVAGDEIMAFYRFPNGVNGIFESRRGLMERNDASHMGLVVAGTKGSLAVRYSGERSLRFKKGTAMPPEDEASFEELSLQESRIIPDALPLNYEELGMKSYDHFYFGTNNRFAAWDLLCAIRDGSNVQSGSRDARIALEMIVGTYAAHLSGHPVSLPLKERRHPLEIQ